MSLQTITKIIVFFTCLLDAFGIGLVFPLLSPLLIEPANGFMPDVTSEAIRGALLGFALAAYAFAQFFSAPILGTLSDHKGRKTILIYAISMAVIGYIIGGFGIYWRSYSLLLFGRIMEGAASGSISVAYATLADISSGRAKTHNFGWLGASWALGFILGPFAGGYLSATELFPGFDYATPFWFASVLSLINLSLVVFFLRETYTPSFTKKMSLWQGITNLRKAWHLTSLRQMLVAMFIFFLGWETFALFIPIFLIDRFGFDSLNIGNFYAFLGGGFVIGNTFILRLVSHIAPDRLLKFGLPAFGLYIFPLMFFHSLPLFIVWLALIPIVGAVLFALGPIHVSNTSAPSQQGEVLGIFQSVQAGSLALPPLLFGSIAAVYPSFSIWGSAVFAFLAGLSFWVLRAPKRA